MQTIPEVAIGPPSHQRPAPRSPIDTGETNDHDSPPCSLANAGNDRRAVRTCALSPSSCDILIPRWTLVPVLIFVLAVLTVSTLVLFVLLVRAFVLVLRTILFFH